MGFRPADSEIEMLSSKKPQPNNSSLSVYVSQGKELRLSNSGQLELLLIMAKRGAALRTRVRGFSMHPIIRDGDILTIEPLRGKKPSLGEIVAFSLPNSGKLAVHRIIAKNQNGWLLRGDFSSQADGAVSLSQMLGRVIHVERHGNKIRLGIIPGIARHMITRLSANNMLIPAIRFFSLFRNIVRRKKQE